MASICKRVGVSLVPVPRQGICGGFHSGWRHHSASFQATGVSQSKHGNVRTDCPPGCYDKFYLLQSSNCAALEGSRVGQNALKLISVL